MSERTYSTDEVMAMMQAPREDVQMLDKPASPFLDPAQINAAERELSDDPNFFVDQTPAPQRPDGGNSTLYPSRQETQPSLPKPVYSTDEVMALYTNESKPVYSTQDVMKQMIAPLYDPTAPRPSRDEYFKLKEMEKSLKESGDIEDPGAFEIGARAVGGLLVTAADALATATFKVDPKDALFTVGGIGVNPGKAIDDTLKRKDATVRLAGEFVKQQYNAMAEGLAAIGGPKYRVKETGEFVTSMQQALGAAQMGQAGGMGGVPAADDSALIDRYKQQGLTLVPVGEQDLKDWEYLQWNKKMDRNLAVEQAANTPRPPDILYRLAAGLRPSVTDYITGRNDYADAVAPVLANESQANVLSMGVDPMVWATSGVGATTRLGISAAAKGATAETLGIMGKLAQKVVQPTEQALTKAEAFKKLVVSPAKVASAYGAASGVAWAADKLELPSELKTAAFTAASLYGAYKAGVGVLRFTANKLPEASVILRESANATNGFDVAARKAVAANADVPFSIRERLLRPSQFVAMESTPARLAKNMELSPGTRAMMDKLSNWYVVQGVRGASAVATGSVKGAAASIPFAELMRSAGDEESANAIYGMGATFGMAGGAAERVFGAKGRRFAQAESDVARFLTDVQGNTVNLKYVKRYQWINAEVGRLLTDVELGAGDVSALVKNRSFDELARTAAMHGFFRDRVDFVPLNAADFELNAKGHGDDGSAGYFINAPDGQRPRIFVNVEARRADVEPHEFYEAFFSSDAFSPEQKASMRAAVDQRYGEDGLMARGREYAEALIKAENAKNFPGENLVVTSDQIVAKMGELSQSELQRGGQDALDWVRREVMVEEARMAGIDYAAMRRNVPAGQNPITFVENLLGANARALGLSGVRVDPETGMAVTPEQLFKENPVAAGDPKLVKQLNGYLKAYKQWLNDPAQETPKGVRVAPDGRAESLANNPNVAFYDGINGKENAVAFVDASGRVVEKAPRQRAKERKLRGQQVRNMVGSKLLNPDDTTFGLKRWADGRVRAGGKRLPDVMALQTHWKPWLPIIRNLEAMADAGESVQVRYFAKGNSADKVKSSRLSDIDAINREMVFDQWTTNAAGDLLGQFLDLTSVRNRAMKAIAERHPALDPANGGPGYSLQKIMDDVNQWMADKRSGKAGEATIGVPRKNVVNALINPGTNFNRGRNDLAGAFGRGSAIKTLLLEGINAVSGTGRKGAAMDYAWANGNFMPDKPAPRPNMDGDLEPPRNNRMPQALPREAMGMPDAPANLSTDQILRELEENQGYLGLSTLGMREGRPVKGGAQRTRELLRRNDELNAELRRRGVQSEDAQLQRALAKRGQAMPDVEIQKRFPQHRFVSGGQPTMLKTGEPVVLKMHHATRRPAQLMKSGKFDDKYLGETHGAENDFLGWYFSSDYFIGDDGEYVGKRGEVLPFYVRMDNPLVIDTNRYPFIEDAKHSREVAQLRDAGGHDGIIAVITGTSRIGNFEPPAGVKEIYDQAVDLTADKFRDLPAKLQDAVDKEDQIYRDWFEGKRPEAGSEILSLTPNATKLLDSVAPEFSDAVSSVERRRSTGKDGIAAQTWWAIVPPENKGQIKSAAAITRDKSSNIIPMSKRFDRTNPDIRFMPDVADAPPFYLKSSQALDAKVQGKAATPDQIKAILTNPQNGIKAEELKWTGVMQEVERLAKENNGKVSKEALLKYLAEDGAVRFEEVTLGGKLGDNYDPDIVRQINDTAREMRIYREDAENVYGPDRSKWPDEVRNGPEITRLTQEHSRLIQIRDETARPILPKYSDGDFVLPGGSNYREVLLTMPVPELPLKVGKGVPFNGDGSARWQGTGIVEGVVEYPVEIPGAGASGSITYWPETFNWRGDKQGPKYVVYTPDIQNAQVGTLAEAMQTIRDAYMRRPEMRTDVFKSSHFDSPNYIAHMRLNERPDAVGRAGLFIEEIQSDRHQKGREKGYREDVTDVATDDEMGRFYSGKGDMSDAEWQQLSQKVENRSKAESGVPDAPFRKEWPLQMFKRALRDAVASGKEWVGWTTGITQVDRYTQTLRQRVRSISWNTQDGLTIVDVRPTRGDRIYLPVKDGKIYRTVDKQALAGKDLAEVIGKEPAAKVSQSASGDLKGDELTIGGEGMKGFYDQILPKEISKYVKQWGGQVEKSSVDLSDKNSAYRQVLGQQAKSSDAKIARNAKRALARLDAEELKPIWRVNITPQMRESIKKAGQALFVGGTAAVVAEDQMEQ